MYKLKAGWIKLGFMHKRTREPSNTHTHTYIDKYIHIYMYMLCVCVWSPSSFTVASHTYPWAGSQFLHFSGAVSFFGADKNVETVTKVIPRRHSQ